MNPLEKELFLWAVIAIGCLFSYTNGFQDGSSVAAAPIASRSIVAWRAVVLTAICEFLGALLGGSGVANAISGISTYPRGESFLVVLAVALSAAVSWNFLTRLLRVPSSSTHALVGGLIGAIFGASGSFQFINWGEFGYLLHPSGVCKVLVTLFMSPLIGFFAGFFCLRLLYFVFARASSRVSKVVKRMQWLVLPVLAFGHGANDTQKVMGLIVLCLASGGVECGLGTNGQLSIPFWVRLLVGAAMTLGVVAMAPGIVKRVGAGIYRQRPVHAFVSEFASAVVVTVGSITGGPVSASQVIASTVMGVGYAQRRKGVHWLVAKDMLMAWFLTIPSAGALAYVFTYWLRALGYIHGAS